jgi:hypothetical protein
MEFNITGIEAQRKKMFETFQELKPVGLVTLTPEPENQYDKFCIGVWYEGTLLGYVPALKEGGVYIGSEIQRHILKNNITELPIVRYGYLSAGGEWNDRHDGWLQSVTLLLPDADADFGVAQGYKRVTEFISYFSPGGKMDNLIKWAFSQGSTFEEYEKALQKTADDGTDMHAAIEEYFRWPLDHKETPFPPELAVRLPPGWNAFVEKYQPRMAYMEERFKDDTLMVTGQPDFVGYVGDRLMVLDWKSSKAVSMKHKLQAAIYAKNVKHEGCSAVGAMIVCFGAKNKQQFSACELDLEKINSYYEAMKHLKVVVDTCGG